MKVKELIKKLKDVPQDAEIVIVHRDWDIEKIEVDEKGNRVRLQ